MSIGNVTIQFIDDLKFDDFYIEDHHGDTLLSAKELYVKVNDYDLVARTIDFGEMRLNEALFFMKKYKGEEQTNLKFLIDYFSSDKTSEDPPFDITAEKIKLTNCEFRFEDFNKVRKDHGIDYSHLRLRGINAELVDFTKSEAFMETDIRNLAFSDQSGFDLQSLTAQARYSDKQIFLGNLEIVTSNSDINTNHLSFNYDSPADFGNFVEKVRMSTELNQSKIHATDLSFFADFFEGFDEKIDFKGNVSGTVSDLSVKEMDLAFGDDTRLKGNALINGLPDIDRVYFDLLFTEINTTVKDLRKIKKPPFKNGEPIDLDPRIEALAYVSGSAKFTGTLDEFTATADLSSGAGRVNGDLVMYYDSVYNNFKYNGSVTTHNFDIGLLAGTNAVGRVSTQLNINSQSKKPFQFESMSNDIHATFDRFEFNGYVYRNIRVDGVFVQNQFDGTIVIDDPNVNLAFDGMVDFDGKIPKYDFVTEIKMAHLYELNLDRSEESQIVCSVITVDGEGSSLDNFKGEIVAKEVSYYLRGKDYFFDSIHITSTMDEYSHDLTLESTVVDVAINGTFRLQELPNAFYALAGRILPSVFPARDDIFLENEDFSFYLNVKDLSLVTELFMPSLKVAPQTQLNGLYESSHQDLSLNLNADWIKYGDYRLNNMHLETERFFDLYEFSVRASRFDLNDSVHLDNFKVVSALFDDNVDAHLQWSSNNGVSAGDIRGEGYWLARDHFFFNLNPSEINVHDGVWEINDQAQLVIDSTTIKLTGIQIVNGDQIIDVSGTISENPNDKLEYTVSGFELATLNPLLTGDVMVMDGQLTANGSLRDFYHHPVYDLEYDINACRLNGEFLGDVWGEVRPHWDTELTEEELDLQIRRGKITALDVQGNIVKNGTYQFDYLGRYYLDGRESPINFNFNLDNMEMAVANGFMPNGLSDIGGLMNGSVRVTGSPDSLLFDGFIIFNEAHAHIDLLNTSYTISGKVSIEHDGFYMSSIPVRDRYGKTATIWDGSFYHINFKEYSYNFQMGMDKPFLVMNTTRQMNSLYYGDAFVTGDIAISYDKYNELEIAITAKTERGTDVVLPLDGAEEVVLPEFITFTDRSAPTAVKQTEMDLSGIKMNFDMEVTEEAQISIVFDEVVGDIMTGNGNGDIHLDIDEYEQFNMYGYYEINEGRYLFTMFDFINKPFNVRKGGTISWYGDPYNADIDLQAVYETKASLYDIMPEGEKDQYRGNTQVNCIMNLEENLFNPDLSFEIELPRSDENARSVLRNLTSSDEELNKQVFSLMVLNKFLPRTNAISGASGSALGAGVGATTSDLLSSQIGSWLNGLSEDIEIGVNAKFGDEVSEDEVAVAMSKTLLNDRLEISGNFGVANAANATAGQQGSRLIGDVSVEYKLNESGSFRVRAFNESNEYDPLQTTSYYTQGVGVYYKESFENWWELRQKLTNIFRRKENDVHHYPGPNGQKGAPF